MAALDAAKRPRFITPFTCSIPRLLQSLDTAMRCNKPGCSRQNTLTCTKDLPKRYKQRLTWRCLNAWTASNQRIGTDSAKYAASGKNIFASNPTPNRNPRARKQKEILQNRKALSISR